MTQYVTDKGIQLALFAEEIGYYAHLPLFEWAHDHGLPWMCAGAAAQGDLSLLKTLLCMKPPCPWNDDTHANAAEFGQLKWLFEQNPPYQAFSHRYMDSFICNYAARGGHIKILEWLHSLNCP